MRIRTPQLKIILAQAIYDNEADFPTELSFQKGDVVAVLKSDPEGYEGWWICSLEGRIGIAPANRLQILGVVQRNEQSSDEHLYDDPTEWFRFTEVTHDAMQSPATPSAHRRPPSETGTSCTSGRTNVSSFAHEFRDQSDVNNRKIDIRSPINNQHTDGFEKTHSDHGFGDMHHNETTVNTRVLVESNSGSSKGRFVPKRSK
ncbi:unnamed protein product [Dicrocoelium dendriticum]|nr:unnamed protein product [Dicrocoelium dendriticum]